MKKTNVIIISRLYERYCSKALGYARTFVKKETAEDVVQEVFLKLSLDVEHKKYKIDDQRVMSLICIMIRHHCLNNFEKGKKKTLLELTMKENIVVEDAVEMEVLSAYSLETLKSKLESNLTIIQRDVLFFRSENYTHKEIAEQIGKSEDAVRQIYKRARGKARKLLEGSEMYEFKEE